MGVPMSLEIDGDEMAIPSPSAAVMRDILRLPVDLRGSTEAATAFALAEELERGRALSASAVAKELVALMDKLRAMAGAVEREEDPLDELARHRVARLSDAAG
jgi:hypothetical protein